MCPVSPFAGEIIGPVLTRGRPLCYAEPARARKTKIVLDNQILTTSPFPPQTTLWPGRTRPELIVDTTRAFLYDPSTNTLVGFDQSWGPGAPLQRMLYAGRTEGTRDL